MNPILLDRRSLLIFFGLRELVAQEAPSKIQDWHEDALVRMAETGRCGVVIVVPAADQESREWGLALGALTEKPADPVKEILCEAVFICMTPAKADATVRRAGEAHNRLLLAPDGTRLKADSIDLAQLAPKTFADSFGGFIRRERPPEPTEAQRDLLRRLGSESIEERDDASALLGRDAAGILPLLAHEGRTSKDPEVAARCRAVVCREFDKAARGSWGPRLPYGCGLSDPVPRDPCPTCGRGSFSIASRRFFQFLH